MGICLPSKDRSWLDCWISSTTYVPSLRPLSHHEPAALQTLSTIPANDDISLQCLRKLQAICCHHATLPLSYITSGEIVRVGDGPIDSGGVADVWEGTYLGKRMSVKCLKVPSNGGQTLKEVRVWCDGPLSHLLKTACGRSYS